MGGAVAEGLDVVDDIDQITWGGVGQGGVQGGVGTGGGGAGGGGGQRGLRWGVEVE